MMTESTKTKSLGSIKQEKEQEHDACKNKIKNDPQAKITAVKKNLTSIPHTVKFIKPIQPQQRINSLPQMLRVCRYFLITKCT